MHRLASCCRCLSDQAVRVFSWCRCNGCGKGYIAVGTSRLRVDRLRQDLVKNIDDPITAVVVCIFSGSLTACIETTWHIAMRVKFLRYVVGLATKLRCTLVTRIVSWATNDDSNNTGRNTIRCKLRCKPKHKPLVFRQPDSRRPSTGIQARQPRP